MQDMNELLRASPQGNNPVRVYVPNGCGTVVLGLHYAVQASRNLIDELAEIMGHEAIELGQAA
ncbi:MAG: hypothetical protein HC837_17280 [Chloroflexaceae bacterium]|nr:hypothetical protein [Chloroflexaceae bacterium]